MTRNPSYPKVSKARIVRAVASSSAIEIGKNVKAIEAKLKARHPKYADLQLALTSSSSV
jgi:hypothetical protein